MKKVLSLFLLASALVAPWMFQWATGGFRLAKVQSDWPYRTEWEVELSEEARSVLTQPFSFLGKGTQCYVFQSRDKQYVIKFFRSDVQGSLEKLKNVFNACLLAHETLKEETGLVYIHLNKSKLGLPVLACTDVRGRKHLFPMDEMRFLIQKKAVGFYEMLRNAKSDQALMRKRIDQFLALLHARTARGVRNDDPSLSRNFGFVEERSIEIDFGNYRFVPGLDRGMEVARFTSKLRRWLKKEAPEWMSYLDEQKESS